MSAGEGGRAGTEGKGFCLWHSAWSSEHCWLWLKPAPAVDRGEFSEAQDSLISWLPQAKDWHEFYKERKASQKPVRLMLRLWMSYDLCWVLSDVPRNIVKFKKKKKSVDIDRTAVVRAYFCSAARYTTSAWYTTCPVGVGPTLATWKASALPYRAL